MDPVVAGALSNVVASVACKVGELAYNSFHQNKDVVALKLGELLIGSDGEESSAIAVAEIPEIERFLCEPEVTALAQASILASRAEGRAQGLVEWQESLRISFGNLVDSWGTGGVADWKNQKDLLWRLVIQSADFALPPGDEISQLPDEDVERLFDVSDESVLAGGRIPAPRYVRQILATLGNSEAINSCRQLCADICAATASKTEQMHLDHAQDRHQFSYDQLYVERSLTPKHVGTDEVLGDIIARPRPGVHVVVVGNPGAGKSTLVSRFINTVSRRELRDYAPVMIRCRELIDLSANRSILDRIVEIVRSDLNISTSVEVVERMLAIGRAFLVFDGIDEVVDLQHRRDLVDLIELLATTYPLTSMICTTRVVGYESAAFRRPGKFSVFVLDEYTEHQVSEYVRRWFAIMQRPDIDRRAFLQESREVQEIRKNPLMLSLLCTLYRIRGYIPINRHDVYQSCANLLFYSWDAMRHIPQPVDHRRYGMSLMEELAYLFFRFPSASAGVEEGQLTGIVASYFENTAGVDRSEAAIRANEFLNFCAGRAWLLTSAGTDSRGGRLFSFTHRTFMEFFAAQAIVRRANTQEEVVEAVIESYAKNSSSVLPDLMVQAYDDKQDRGAERILRDLMKLGHEGRKLRSGSHVSLCVRILNATPVNARLVREVVLDVFRVWSTQSVKMDRASFISLLQLYKDPRRIVIRFLMGGDDDDSSEEIGRYRTVFIRRWARLWCQGECTIFEGDWSELVSDIVGSISPELTSHDSAVRAYMVASGRIAPEKIHFQDSIWYEIKCFGMSTEGLLLRACFGMLASTGAGGLGSRIVRHFDSWVSVGARKIHELTALSIQNGIREALDSRARTRGNEEGDTGPLQRVNAWLACCIAEVSPGSIDIFHDMIRRDYADDRLFRTLKTRLVARDPDAPMSETLLDVARLSRRELDSLGSEFPKWTSRWAQCKTDLIIPNE
ncbi:NACHT domain-containing protein [Actinocatenispora sera]|uniref:NACHT domain-containing protein n=1 Tax=Actinocatenispora sera TaxID=390989 RepID=UPI0033C03038